MKRSAKATALALLGAAVLAGGLYMVTQTKQTAEPASSFSVLEPQVTQENGQTVKTFTLTAEPKTITLKDGATVQALTYGGTVPGSQIRVTQGDKVRVVLKNTLSVPTTIHWHGYPVPNAMDGIPGVTQNAVKPGETYTYEFTATTPGTYWYHSHQDSAVQEDQGLYGSLIVERKEPSVKYDQDVTLVLDEWQTGSMNMDHGNMQGMSHDEMMKLMYNVFTVNGKAGNAIQPLDVKEGQHVKLRLINAGFQTHLLHLQKQAFSITDTDGQPIAGPSLVTDQLVAIAPGERYDLAFTAGKDSFWIDDHNDSKAASDLRIPVRVNGKDIAYAPEESKQLATVDITAYGQKSVAQSRTYDKQFTMDLNNVTDQDGTALYTINGEVFPETKPLDVKKGDWVKVTFRNKGTVDHPMHLHGHFFRVLTKNGQPVADASLEKDTLNVRPGETYEVEFHADNEGEWMFHCHDLHHAAAGMMTEVKYDGCKPPQTLEGGMGNNPE